MPARIKLLSVAASQVRQDDSDSGMSRIESLEDSAKAAALL
jgi:hypothetical protein